MKQTRRFLVISAVLIALCLSLCACGSKPASDVGALSEPSPTPEPTAAPTPEPPATERYSDENIAMDIPAGWRASSLAYDSGGGVMRLFVAVADPEDANNLIFYATAMEPFFASPEDKSAALPHLPGYYEWAPVISGEPSAEAVLRRWASAFTLMQAEGGGFDSYFKNYSLQTVTDTFTDPSSTDDCAITAVLATVSIPDSDSPYCLCLENRLVLSSIPNVSARYYTGFDTCGVVIREELYDAQYETLLKCMQSIDFGGFNGQYATDGGTQAAGLPTDVILK